MNPFKVRLNLHGDLDFFLRSEARGRSIERSLSEKTSVKDAIESCGVPHPEVDLILVDGRSVDFAHVLRGGERVSVYPMFESLDITPLLRLRPRPLRDPRFVADDHLRSLARHLRM